MKLYAKKKKKKIELDYDDIMKKCDEFLAKLQKKQYLEQKILQYNQSKDELYKLYNKYETICKQNTIKNTTIFSISNEIVKFYYNQFNQNNKNIENIIKKATDKVDIYDQIITGIREQTQISNCCFKAMQDNLCMFKKIHNINTKPNYAIIYGRNIQKYEDAKKQKKSPQMIGKAYCDMWKSKLQYDKYLHNMNKISNKNNKKLQSTNNNEKLILHKNNFATH